jgi:hypothetical protein
MTCNMVRCSSGYDVKYGKVKENNTEIAVQVLKPAFSLYPLKCA